MQIISYGLRKAGVFIFYMIIFSFCIFYIAHISPGDPLQSFYGDMVERMSAEEQWQARQRLGVDDSALIRYSKWASLALTGDFGISFKYRMPATEVLNQLWGNTVSLGLAAYILTFISAIVIGFWCVHYEGSYIDRMLCKLGTTIYFIPSFWLGLVCILIFSVHLHWFPAGGLGESAGEGFMLRRIQYMVLPTLVMVISHFWYYAYMIRNRLVQEVRKEYVVLAKAKGFSTKEILCRHCWPNVRPMILNMMSISVPHIIGGTYVIEAVFAYPGIGLLIVESAKYHDYNMLMLISMITGGVVLVCSFIHELFHERFIGKERYYGK